MENSSDDVSCLSPQNLGSSSPSKKQSKENTITVSGSRAAGGVAGWDSGPWLGCCHGIVDLSVEAMPSRESGKFRSLGVAEVSHSPLLPCPSPSSVDFLFHFFPPGKQVEGWCSE